ncbi:MAG: hypothetical protein K8T91_08805 [Planctomycetes bacterium]|nr:hypothetical protein [Planctomycetota bacterium]
MFATRQYTFVILLVAMTIWIPGDRLVMAEESVESTGPAIAKLIEQLDDDDFGRREEASQRLVKLGAAAVPALANAAQQPSAEVSTRSLAILKKLIASEDEALRTAVRQALKEIAAKRETAEKNKDQALATAAATAKEILGQPFLGLFGYGMADNATVGAVVEGSPAEKAGMKAMDVVISFGGTPTPTFQDLIAAVGKKG